MKRKKLDIKKIQEIKKKISKKTYEDKIIFEQKIYYQRQFSVKIPKRFIDYIGFKEGDLIRFSVLELNKLKPKIRIDYVRENDILSDTGNT